MFGPRGKHSWRTCRIAGNVPTTSTRKRCFLKFGSSWEWNPYVLVGADMRVVPAPALRVSSWRVVFLEKMYT